MSQTIWRKILSVPPATLFVNRQSEPTFNCTYSNLVVDIENFSDQLEMYFRSEKSRSLVELPAKTSQFYAFSLACLFCDTAPIILNPSSPVEVHRLHIAEAKRVFSPSRYVSFASPRCETSFAQTASKFGLMHLNFAVSELGSKRKLNEARFVVRDSESLAWTFFTSGTTGKPKLIRIPWRAVQSFTGNILKLVPLTLGQRVSQVFSPWFDPFFADLMGAALQGATLIPSIMANRYLMDIGGTEHG